MGLVADNGAPFGVAGLMQGDPRFGDIRIGARPMSPEVMAITVPPDPYMSGTLSGDMILNSSADLNPSDLFDVALHEAGLALGLGESTDPTSVMYPVINPQATLSPSDIQNIQALYGTRAPDPNVQQHDRHRHPDQSTAALPRDDAAGGLRRPRHALGYRLLLGAAAPALLRAGHHPAPDLGDQLPATTSCRSIDQNFKLLGEAQSTSDLGDIVSVQLPNVNPFQQYYIEVDSPATDVFGIGRYALSVTYDGRSLVNPASLPAILRGPYDSLSAGDLAGLLGDAGDVLFNNDPAHERHVPDRRAALEPARLSGEHPVSGGGEPRRHLRCRHLSNPGTAGPRRADRRLDREPGPDAGQRGIARRLGLRCQHQSGARPRSCSTATAPTSSRPPA